jgi:hypothetical protein
MLAGNQASGVARAHWGFLRGARFDTAFIVGVAALALLSGALVARLPQLFTMVLLCDLWLLSYHHVIATFTRIAFDRASFHQHRFAVLVLPAIILAATIAAVKLIGVWVVPTIYFYWQWFHYTRQSYGISRIYQLKTETYRTKKDRLGEAMLYLVALVGVLHRSAEGSHNFLGTEVRLLPVPPLLVWVVGVAAGAAVLSWVARELRNACTGKLQSAHALYLGSHVVIFAVGYLVIPNIDLGWLVVNIWHNGQYLLLVWMFNNNRFKDGPSPAHRFLSWISQTRRWPFYLAACLAITTAFYGALAGLTAAFTSSTLPVLLIVYQVVNFHHYVVDARIWKVRRKPVRETLGIVA